MSDNRDSELDRARQAWQKKFGNPPINAAEKTTQVRFMQGRGFMPEGIRRAIGGDDNQEMYSANTKQVRLSGEPK